MCILIGIIAFFVLLLSIPIKVSLSFDDKIHLSVKYLFIKLDILPTGPKKEKAPKPKKEPEPKPEKPKDETPKEKKPNPIIEMVKANGYDGMMLVIKNLGRVLGIYGGKLFKSIVFDEIDVYISVGTGDAASTAIKYGETCQKVYPVLGFICSNNIVKKYDILVEPDFLANKTENELFIDFSVTVRKIINATLAMVFRLIFSVALKFILGAKKGKENTQSKDTNTAQKAENMNG
jgi:hypothetical protein